MDEMSFFQLRCGRIENKENYTSNGVYIHCWCVLRLISPNPLQETALGWNRAANTHTRLFSFQSKQKSNAARCKESAALSTLHPIGYEVIICGDLLFIIYFLIFHLYENVEIIKASFFAPNHTILLFLSSYLRLYMHILYWLVSYKNVTFLANHLFLSPGLRKGKAWAGMS